MTSLQRHEETIQSQARAKFILKNYVSSVRPAHSTVKSIIDRVYLVVCNARGSDWPSIALLMPGLEMEGR